MADIKRIVNTKFWQDEKVLDNYSVEDKYFMLYILTNPRTSQLGIYKLPKKIASFETGYTREVIEVLLQRFRDKYKNILYNDQTQEIALLNSLKYSIVKGGAPVVSLLEKELSQIESDELILTTYKHMIEWWAKSGRDFDKTVKEMFEKELQQRKVAKEINGNENVNGNENDNEESYPESGNESYPESSKEKPKSGKPDNSSDIPFSKIIFYLNEKAERSYRPNTSSTKKLIKARWEQGFRTEEFKTVIDNQVHFWKKDKRMNQYLRPETLFGTKFESYLNNKPNGNRPKPSNEFDWE